MRGQRSRLAGLLGVAASLVVAACGVDPGDEPGRRTDVSTRDHPSAADPGPDASASGGDAPPANLTGIEPTECWFKPPPGRQASCGVLTVPERWHADRSRALHLKFVVFHAAVLSTADPIIYVNGGPGDAANIDDRSIGRWWALTEATSWLKARDLIVFDPRGVGLSEPSMNCPELADAAARVFTEPRTLAEDNETWSGAAERCRDRLRGLGIALDQYTTDADIADLHSLITHLGYRSWILLAVSYGTRVALGVIDRWHDGASAVILDSVYPEGAAAYADVGRSVAAAFATLFRECDDRQRCHADFPEIAATFERVVRRAAVMPIAISVANPLGGPRLQAQLEDSRLIEVFVHAFYDWRDIARLPAIIAALAVNDAGPLQTLADATLNVYASDQVSHGVFFSVGCRNAFPVPGREAMDRLASEPPLYRKFTLSNLLLAVCPSWPADPAGPEERFAANRDVPILILSGELDPFTPPQWARTLAATRKAVAIEFRGVGHGVLAAHACASRIVERFLHHPTGSPVDDCLLAVGVGAQL